MMATSLLIFSVTWLMAFGFSWGNTFAQLRNAQQNVILIQRQFQTKKPLTREEQINAANQELVKLRSLRTSVLNYTDIINDVRAVLPDDIIIRSLQYGLGEDKTLFELSGYAPDRESVISTYDYISYLPFVEKVYFPASNFDERLYQVTFSLTFKVQTPQ